MADQPERALHYGIDRLVIRGKRVFGWGWAADRRRGIDAITLAVEGDGWEQRLPVKHGLGRDDVRAAHPMLIDAGASGFLVTGYIARLPVRKFVLEVRFDDGSRAGVDITDVLEARAAGRRRVREVAWVARAVLRRLRHRDFAGILRRARAQNYGAPALDSIDIVESLAPALRAGRAVSIVFDHNMGGGANLYRDTLIEERVATGRDVLLCTYNLPTLDYRVHLFRPAEDARVYRVASFLVLEAILEQAGVDELFLNSPVSFDEPLLFADWLASMRAAHPKLRFTIAVHDYFAVCPSFVLLNADGRYCGIPDVSECAKCLQRHRASYVALSPPTEIEPWRASWARSLDAADEVRCFSESTRALLLRAYPGLDRARITVVPHRVDFIPPRLPALDHAAPLTIGIVGQISEQKGAGIVRDLLARIDRAQRDVRVVVIGTLDAAPASRRLEVTGVYHRQDLAGLIETHGVNLCLFPSICPETFSYVVEEMMRLALPIVAFDLGAPGDRLRGYARARLCRDVSAEAALATLIEFHNDLAAQTMPTANVR